jgi:ubiquinone/menaquinone biosynthesis C-methylase UbiE
MIEDTIEYSYEPFSREPEYMDVNHEFVRTLPLAGRCDILDLACGTGTLTSMLLAELEPLPVRRVRLVCSDLSHVGLGLAREYVTERHGAVRDLEYVQASADRIPFAGGSFDAVTMGNAIQMLEDKNALAAEVARVLRPGGLFAFNTSFYSGAYLPQTERFYIRWVQEAFAYIQHKDEALRSAGTAGIRRKKGGRPAFSNPWLSAGEYSALLARHGFSVLEIRERTVMLTRSSFETIGSYAGLATVLLSGYPASAACEALKAAAGPALEAERCDAVPRHWIEFTAVKTEGHDAARA